MKLSESKPLSVSPPIAEAVAEVQGLYGTFSFPERLLQKIWHRGDFDSTALRTADGRELKVLHAGKWNHLGGPDFSGARLVFDGKPVTGDVELHLHAKDWEAHQHATDPAYGNVVLHVVLFPSRETATLGVGGRMIPVLCLLPLLHHGLEEYAAEEAMEQMAGRPLHHAQETLGRLSSEELDTMLRDQAARRWRAKVHFAKERIGRLEWEGACHHTALEILGYRFNRTPMLLVASAFPLRKWDEGRVEPAEAFARFADRWSLQGVRPLNHPRLRLEQYHAWCRANPDWPAGLLNDEQLRGLVAPPSSRSVGKWRKAVGATLLRSHVRDRITGGVLGGSRLDNMIADGLLPLLAAETGADYEEAWCSWFAGDAPETCMRILRGIGVFDGRERPVAQGPIQGLLGWMLAHETVERA